MKVGTGIGIAALIIAVIGMFLPVIGLFLGWIGLIVACFAALFGDKGLSIATVIVSIIGFLFLTPSLWIEAAGTASSGSPAILRIITIVLVLAPIVCMILNSTGRLMLGKPPQVPLN